MKYEIKATEEVSDMIGDNKKVLRECGAKAFNLCKNLWSVKRQDSALSSELNGLQQENLEAANRLKEEQEAAAKSIAEAEEANRKLKAALGVLKNEVRSEKKENNKKKTKLNNINNKISDVKMETELAGI